MPVPIENAVTEAIISTLRGITEANGFETNVTAVYDVQETVGNPDVVTPAVFIDDADVDYSQEVNNRSTNELTLRLGLMIQSGPTARLALDYFVADVRKAFHAELILASQTPSAGEFADLGVFNVRFLGSRRSRAVIPGSQDLRVCILAVAVDYRDLIDDPYTSG